MIIIIIIIILYVKWLHGYECVRAYIFACVCVFDQCTHTVIMHLGDAFPGRWSVATGLCIVGRSVAWHSPLALTPLKQ